MIAELREKVEPIIRRVGQLQRSYFAKATSLDRKQIAPDAHEWTLETKLRIGQGFYRQEIHNVFDSLHASWFIAVYSADTN